MDAVRVARGAERRLVAEDETESALEQREHVERGLFQAERGARQQAGDELGVGRGRQHRSAAAQARQPLGHLSGVGQVAVVAERDAAAVVLAVGRLRVLPRAGAGGGVAGVADGDVAGEAAEGDLVEDLRDEAELLVDDDALAVADRDAGGFLAAVLKRVKPVVRELGDLFTARESAEDTAGVAGPGIVVQIVGKSCRIRVR